MSLLYQYRDAVNEFKRLEQLREQALMPPFWSPLDINSDPLRFTDDRLRVYLDQLNRDIAKSRDEYNAVMGKTDADGNQKGPVIEDSRVLQGMLVVSVLVVGLLVLTSRK